MTTQAWTFAGYEPRRRTGRAMSTSFVLHAMLLLWLVLRPHITGVPEILTEIQYYEELPVAQPAQTIAVKPAAPITGSQPVETRFSRSTRQAESEPQPQSDFSLNDQIASRLDALRNRSRVAAIASAQEPSRLVATGPATTPPTRGEPIDLTRGQVQRAPLALERGVPVARPVAAVAPTHVPKAQSERPADALTATRKLAGALITGQVADRPIASYVKPVYPEWAKRDAVEGSVTVRFVVRPDGTIKENVFVQKTAGFEDFDLNAVTAIRAWRFAPLTGGRVEEQWGAITFHFRLSDAG
jgi:TonB family protein